MPLPHDLLALARDLVDRNPGAPVEADLRRGVSTAYYAVFHLLVDEAMRLLIAPAGLRARVARAFNHGTMKSVCQEYARLVANPAGQFQLATGEIVPPEIQRIASEFVALQEARSSADYNTGIIVTHAEAVTDVVRAASAFAD